MHVEPRQHAHRDAGRWAAGDGRVRRCARATQRGVSVGPITVYAVVLDARSFAGAGRGVAPRGGVGRGAGGKI